MGKIFHSSVKPQIYLYGVQEIHSVCEVLSGVAPLGCSLLPLTVKKLLVKFIVETAMSVITILQMLGLI